MLTNAVITWTTEYYQLAVQQLRAADRDVPDELLAHISPAHSENVNFFGVITVDVEAELAKLDGSDRPGKNRIGRPRTVGPAELKTLRRLVADGVSVTEAARTLKIGRATAYQALTDTRE